VPCSTRDEGFIEFGSNEHAYVWTKLRYLGLVDDADRCLVTPSPKTMMLAAKRVIKAKQRNPRFLQLCNLWHDIYAEQLLADLVFVKARQHPHFRRFLIEHVDKTFVESTADSFWGCGMHARDIQTISGSDALNIGGGLNIFGQILKRAATLLTDPVFTATTPIAPELTSYVEMSLIPRDTRLAQKRNNTCPWPSYVPML